MIEFNEEKQTKRFDDLKKQEEEDLAKTLSSKYGVTYLDLSAVPVNIDALRVIKEGEARDIQMAVFDIIDKLLPVV